jgi:hypothetical protein
MSDELSPARRLSSILNAASTFLQRKCPKHRIIHKLIPVWAHGGVSLKKGNPSPWLHLDWCRHGGIFAAVSLFLSFIELFWCSKQLTFVCEAAATPCTTS